MAVVLDEYRDPKFPKLEGAVTQVNDLATALTAYGYESQVVVRPLLVGVSVELDRWSEDWSARGQGGPAVVVWSGHAEGKDGKPLRLAAFDTARGTTNPNKYYSPVSLASHSLESGADQVLILLDTCHSGAGAIPALDQALDLLKDQTLPEGRVAWFGVLASCQADERAEGGRGRLLEAVLHLLTEGPRGSEEYRHEWSVRNEGITGATLIKAVLGDWQDGAQRAVDVSTGQPRAMFRNPLWRPKAGEALVEHLVLAAKGIDPTEEGWFFTGRQRALRQIVDWLAAKKAGMLLLTGSAGVGKSAVAGRIAALSDAAERADLMAHAPLTAEDPDPGDGSVDAAIHLRGMTVQSLAKDLADRLGLAVPRTPADLIAQLERADATTRQVLVLDGLDEAAPGEATPIAEQLLVPLSRLCTVLLASRDRPFQPHQEPGEALDSALTRTVGAAVHVLDLDQEQDTASDIATYVRDRLLADDVAPDKAAEIAPVLAARASTSSGGFLFARIVASRLAHTLAADPDLPWRERIPAGIEEALAADLATAPARLRDGRELSGAAHDLLTALAWAGGAGIPAHGVWQAVAQAVGGRDTTYEPEDIDWVLRQYGRYIVEDSDGYQAVYRLYHRELVTHLRTRTPAAVPVAIIRALVTLALGQTDNGTTPTQANPYLRQHLASHAVEASGPGVTALRELVELNPDAYLPNLAGALNNLANQLAGIGRRQEALTTAQEAVTTYRNLVELNPDAYLPNLATSLNNLANQLAGIGRRQEALTTAQEAVTTYRNLVELNPDAYLPNLAMSLHNLAVMMSGIGRRQEALAPAQEAVTTYRNLVELNPDAYLPNLAAALINLADQLAGIGRRQEALAPAQEAVTTYRNLVELNPDAYLPNLAMSLNNLAAMMSGIGRRQEALAPAQEAVRLRRNLVELNPDAYLPDLAMSLNNLAAMMSGIGRRQEALAPAQEAVRLRRNLVELNPDAYLPDLAMSLNNLANHLSEVGRRQEALTPAQEAVTTYRNLVELNPDAYLPNLAGALTNLANQLSEVGRRQEALTPAQEAVRLRRNLVELNPDAYLPDLAGALNNLANQLSEVGRRQEALTTAQEAVTTYRNLVELNPDAYLPDLAGALNNVANRLAGIGRQQEALTTAQEAVTTYRNLVELNPDAYLPNLAMSLNNLAAMMSGIGRRQEAVQIYDDIVTKSSGRPGLAAKVSYHRAVFLLETDQGEGVTELCRLLSSTKPEDNDTAFQIRRSLRQIAQADHEARKLVVRAHADHFPSSSEAPSWLDITDADLQLTVDWLSALTWRDSRDFITTHPELLEPPAQAALREWSTLGPANFHLALLERLVSGDPVDTVYRSLVLPEILIEWMSTASEGWAASAAYLTDHAEDLLTPDADASLAAIDDAGLVADVHRALLAVALDDGIDAAYELLQNRQVLHARVQKALAAADGATLRLLSAIEVGVYGDVWVGAVHWSTAWVLDDPEASDETAHAPEAVEVLREAVQAKAPDGDERNRMVAELAALMAARPARATALGDILQAVLAT
ncbi:ATP-binding protein [Saccharothrix violaceirubra]|uniref:ATP-binding protein n=1 Tax=Saccharothrix violaceirubra TaxID=413306 RepID=UPI001C882FCC|nr:ATP-binding protein [Saccharothrix violaceirubra]